MGCSCSSAKNSVPVSIHELYAFHDKLGQGAFGQVRTCVHRNTEREYAVKILDVEGSSTRKQEAQREGFLWKQAGGHRNIVSLIESYNDKDFSYFVMEKCERSLVNMLLEKSGVEEGDLLDTFRQMLLGLEHCHKMKVVHRDVKPANFLVSKDGIVKLCDFGLAELEKPAGLYGIIGTAPFMSPEMVNSQAYDQKTDVWSLGATAYMMLYGRYLYKINKDKTKFKKVRASDLMHRAIATDTPKPTYEAGKDLPEPSALARGFVQALLQRDPQKRMTATQCLKLDAVLPRVPSQAKARSNLRSLAPAIRLVKQATEEFKAPVDPTVAKTMDQLINQMQAKFRRPSTTQFATTYSVPISGEKSLGCSLAYSKWSPTFSHGGEMSVSPTLLQSLSLNDSNGPVKPKGLSSL